MVAVASLSYLAEKNASISAVSVGLLSALQEDNGLPWHVTLCSQPITQTVSVQGKKCSWYFQGFIPQPKKGSRKEIGRGERERN